ncbi:hypothetical protein EUTSA_v10016212mg [Eutrema salsugineum]|uniref:RRM domain-containing protein n=1 Tax=Eutrema salsugineum TaxID=72664 RepID=V4LN02_EUTSA|nr:hypothetical protein EUTSA_v10016212mg [Eutrema salsugineum]ESQ51940.1 hypothetical protein EUTSA_v10016212mg [Eutrema salsugineum]
MNEVSKQKDNPDGHEKHVNEGSAARTRPTTVEEIMLRRKRKESLENVKEKTVGAAQLPVKDLVEKASDYHESGKRYDTSKKVSREERVKKSSRKKEDTIFSSREERLDKPMKEDPVGAVQLPGNDLVEKVPDCHVSEKVYDRSEILSHEELVNDSSRKKEEVISSFREERLDKTMKEDPVEAAQLLGNDLVENVSDYHEKGNDRSTTIRLEESVKDSSRKKEDVASRSREERLDDPVKEDPVGAAQLLGNDLVKKVSDNRASRKELERSKKVSREERVKDSTRKKEDAASGSKEERVDKPMKENPQLHRNDLVEKVPNYHASEKEHDRSKKVRREERVKDSSRKKEEAISGCREERSMKEVPVGAGLLLGNDLVEKVSDYHESEKGYERSETLRREERVKDKSRKKEEAISSSREDRLDKPTKDEEPATNRKRKAEGECSTAETKLAEEHFKDSQRKKEETNSSCREERLDKKMKREDRATNRKIRVEREFPTTEIKMTDRDGLGVDTKIKAKRESTAAKTSGTGREQARSALESLPGSRKRLRSLVVAEIPRDEHSMKPDDGNKRANQNGDHMKNRESDMSRTHDPAKVHSVEVSERWEKKEHPKSNQRNMREKRRRSRSRDHGQDRQKRSSPLPRAEKATSRHKRDHEERSENIIKDRPGQHHFKDHENKVASTVNNKSRRYSSSKSELGGYSPRKRREEASAKAASPLTLPSDKQSAKWDLAPTVPAGMLSGSVFSGLQAATQTPYPIISEASLTLLKPLMEASLRTPPARQTTSVDSVQLTESTRRLRRLYAENVPDSASEKSLIECFNSYMLSSGSNHIKGSEPCISCIINKEKSQALLEFLTPQDASAALSLDGYSFAGSNLKIRRPKDYVESTGVYVGYVIIHIQEADEAVC